jgi:hypothetical protein
VQKVEVVPKLGYSVNSNLSTIPWIKQQFSATYLDQFTGLQKVQNPFDGLDAVLLLSWALQRFSAYEDQPFVLHYWDLRTSNIIIDEDENLVGWKAYFSGSWP